MEKRRKIKTLTTGSAGKTVEEVKSRLLLIGHMLEPDDKFDPPLRAVLRNLQIKWGLPVSGDLDDETFVLVRNLTAKLMPYEREFY